MNSHGSSHGGRIFRIGVIWEDPIPILPEPYREWKEIHGQLCFVLMCPQGLSGKPPASDPRNVRSSGKQRGRPPVLPGFVRNQKPRRADERT